MIHLEDSMAANAAQVKVRTTVVCRSVSSPPSGWRGHLRQFWPDAGLAARQVDTTNNTGGCRSRVPALIRFVSKGDVRGDRVNTSLF